MDCGGAVGGGAAFTNPSSGKIDQQRKILEELERQKKLLKSGNGAGLVSSVPPTLPGTPGAGGVAPQAIVTGEGRITSGQRNALESANKTSFGFFIPQDSDFGNIILPVIPRIPNKNPPKI